MFNERKSFDWSRSFMVHRWRFGFSLLSGLKPKIENRRWSKMYYINDIIFLLIWL